MISFNRNRKQSGKLAKIVGDQFENLLQISAIKHRIEFIKIPSGHKTIKVKGKLIHQRVRTPFDFIFVKNGKSVYFDAKTIESGNFCYSDLKSHQVNSLYNLEMQNVVAGYVIYYRDINQVIFYKASILRALKQRDSLKLDQGLYLGKEQEIDLNLLLHLF